MTAPVVVLDSGLVDLATADREFRWLIRDLVATGWTPLIPTVVLAEALTGRPSDAPANQTIHRLDTVDTDQAMARRAGILRFGCQTSAPGKLPSGIDAIVAAHAADVGEGVVFTTDPKDLRRLLIEYPKIRVEKP
ncbi:MAG: type II toxin-antitoxin system VapC family toxin [Pseudonocardiaceae bacterium]